MRRIVVSATRLACGIWISLLPATLLAQPGEIELEHLTVEDGLSHSTVRSIHQDAGGFLWFGTQEGLNRYDGYSFKVFKHDPDDPASLLDSWISVVYGDRRGQLWVGTAGGGLSRLDANGDGFVHYLHDPADETSLNPGEVQALLEDRDGGLWIGTSGGLDRLAGLAGVFSHHPSAAAEPDAPAPAVLALHQDRDGRLWAGAGAGLYRLDAESGALVRYRPAAPAAGSRWDGKISAIREASDGLLWLAAGDALIRLQPRDDTVELFRYQDLAPGAAGEHLAAALAVDRAGGVWLGFDGHGVSRLDSGNGQPRHYGYESLDPWGLSDNGALAIFEDRTGILWLGTYVGLNKYDPAREQFITYRQRGGRGLSSSSIWAIHEDRAGALWVGNYDSGLDRVDPPREAVTHYPPDPDDPGALPNGTVSAVLEDASGRLWVGTWAGLSRLDRDRGRFVTYRHDPADPTSLSDVGVSTLHLDGSGRLWIGTYSGLDRYDPAGDHFIRYPTDPRDPEILGQTPIYAICEGRGGELWFGSDRDGLYRLDPESERFATYRHDPSSRDSLSSDKIASLLVDRAGVLWAGTYGGGLNRLESGRLNPSSARFTRLREKDGLSNDSVLGILEDARGHLWLATNNGLSRFDPAAETFRTYGVGNGLQGTVYSTGSAFQSASGEMFFGGVRGLDAFFPESVIEDPHPPPVAITGLRRFSRSRPLETVRLEPLPAGNGELVLSHRDYAVGFEFAALHYRSPRGNRYAYQLEGFDPGWIEVDSARRFARYSSLPAGNYTFRVKASNSDGVWNQDGARVRIRVLPPPWQTWWAYALYGLTLIASFAGYSRWQRRRVEREREISRRLREVDRLKDEFLANTSHELRTPLFGITGLAESLIDGATGELSDKTRENLSMIVASGRRLSGLVGDILDFSRLSKKSLELRRQPVDLHALVDVVLSLSRPLVGSKDLELVNAVAPDLPPADADENRLQQVMHNLVGNAVKFTESGTVEVSAVDEDERLLVRVSDTGIGISEDQLDRIFEPFEQVDASDERTHGGTGLGLAVSHQLIKLHGGSIWVESSAGVGATFSFTLPTSRRPADTPAPGDGSLRPLSSPLSHSPAQTVSAPSSERPQGPGSKRPVTNRDNVLPAGEFRLLIVDDEPVIRQVLNNYLSARGYLLDQASSGAEALRLLEDKHCPEGAQTQRYDLVLLDVMMPRMSGYDVCRQLRRRHSRQDLPVIFLTAKHRASDLETGFACGANDYLTKPIAKRELVSRVAAHLELLDAHRKLESLLAEKTEWNAELEARNAELARFTYTVSHDLKSPLVTINGFLGLLERDAKGGHFERMEHDLQRIRGATGRMQQLLNDLLELSRIGRTASEPEAVDLAAVACEALAMVAGQVAERGAEVTIAPDLPPVTGDRLRLVQVYQNLFENAVKYMGDQPSPRVDAGARHDAGETVFFVADNGIGIDPEYQRKVFGLFERLDAGTEGTGVGLALVKRIVEVHGGRIWIESEGRGSGATFCFTLPSAGLPASGV